MSSSRSYSRSKSRSKSRSSSRHARASRSFSKEASRRHRSRSRSFRKNKGRVRRTAPARREGADDGGRKVYVGNLSSKAHERDLEEVFSKCGNIEDVYIPRDKVTWLGRGFAFVTFETKDAALDATEEWDGRKFMGKRLGVNLARPRPPARGGSPTSIRKYVPSRDDEEEEFRGRYR